MSESNTQPAGQSVLKQKTPADPSPQPERGIPQHSELAFPGVLLGAASWSGYSERSRSC